MTKIGSMIKKLILWGLSLGWTRASHYLDQTYQNLDYSQESLLDIVKTSTAFSNRVTCDVPSRVAEEENLEQKIIFSSLLVDKRITQNLVYIQAEAHYYSYELEFGITNDLFKSGFFEVRMTSSMMDMLNIQVSVDQVDPESLRVDVKNDGKFSCHVSSFKVAKESGDENFIYCQSGSFLTGYFEIDVKNYAEQIQSCAYRQTVSA